MWRLVFVLTGAFLYAQEPPAPDVKAMLTEARQKLNKGDTQGARQSLDEAWADLEKSIPEDPLRYDALKLQSSLATMLGQYAEAEQYIRMAINWRMRVSRTADPKIADEYVEIAMLCHRQKEYERGLAELQQAMKFIARNNEYESTPVADVLSRMALMHLGMKNAAEVVYALEEAVKIRTKVSGAEHVSLLPDLDRLGTTLIAQRSYDKAETVYRRILSIRDRQLGPTDPDLLQTVEGLGYALFGQKKYPEAEAMYQRLLKLWETSAGTEHPMVAQTLEKIAILYREQKRWDESVPYAERALAIRALFQASGLGQEANARFLHGDRREAEELYLRALSLLNPERGEHKELYAKIEAILKEIAPKKATKK